MAEGRHGAGEYLSAQAYGHVGFTGTSLWIDPQRDMFVILLTNRVHAARARRPATVIADVRSDLADAAALSVTDEDFRITVMPAAFRADRAVNWNKPLRVKRSRHKSTKSRRGSATAGKPSAKAGASSKAKPVVKATSSPKGKASAKKPTAKPTAKAKSAK
jgi:CubicO group peptidase (beta-lactamase class C family)